VQITVISNKIKQASLREAEQEYLKRLKNSVRMSLVEVPHARGTAASVEETKNRESQKLLDKAKSRDFLIVLDEKGKEVSSVKFSGLLSEQMNAGNSSFSFAIGGAAGWSPEALKRADFVLSLSKMTFPYQMTRLILIEQIYRAFSIINNEPYHKA